MYDNGIRGTVIIYNHSELGDGREVLDGRSEVGKFDAVQNERLDSSRDR